MKVLDNSESHGHSNDNDDYNPLERLISIEKRVLESKEAEWKHQFGRWSCLSVTLLIIFLIFYFAVLPVINTLFLSLKSPDEL